MARGDNQLDRILDVVGRIYDAALDETLWSAVAPEIAGALESGSTALLTIEDRSIHYLSSTANQTDVIRKEYEDYYHAIDVWVAGGVKFGLGHVVTSQDIMPDSQFAATEIYQDYSRKIDVFHLIGSVIPVAANHLAVLGIHRARRNAAYHETDKVAVSQLLPHLQRGLQIRRRLAEAEIGAGMALDALNRSGTATLVVGREGKLLYANRNAEALLRMQAGLTVGNGRLTTGDRRAAERFRGLIHAAIDTAAGEGMSSAGALAVERGDRLPLTLLVAPFRPARDGFGPALPAAIVFVRDPEQPTPMTLALQGLFGLTPSEAAITNMLTEGRSTDEIATRHHIAPKCPPGNELSDISTL